MSAIDRLASMHICRVKPAQASPSKLCTL